MRKLMVAFVAALVPLCAQAKTAKPAPEARNLTEYAFQSGKNLGHAETLVAGCNNAAVDPKIKQAVFMIVTAPYTQVFAKGFDQGVHEAVQWTNELPRGHLRRKTVRPGHLLLWARRQVHEKPNHSAWKVISGGFGPRP